MNDLVLTPSQFVGMLNQTLELAYPLVVIEGELSEFKVRKNQWVYFKLKDDEAVIDFFGSVYQLKAPLEDGMMIRAIARPRMSPRYGFSLSFESVTPVGEGSLKRAFELLRAKLEAEGLFSSERKRALPSIPSVVGLISSHQAAGAEDFLKILSERWGHLEVRFANVSVQGVDAPGQIRLALDYFNQYEADVEVLVIVRGGGSAEDLAAFNDEALVRAVASSRVPVLVGIGHEQDISLTDLAADARAATPTEAAIMLVPDQHQMVRQLAQVRGQLAAFMQNLIGDLRLRYNERLGRAISQLLDETTAMSVALRRSLMAYDPKAVLSRGYSILRSGQAVVISTAQIKVGDHLSAELSDGQIETEVSHVKNP